MKAKNPKFILLSCILASAALARADSASVEGAGEATSQSAPPPISCGFLTVPIGPGVPGDSPIFSDQTNADCFGWWEFISLNWPADPGQAGAPDQDATAANFGTPGNLAPVVWETYIDPSLLFPPSGAVPPPFGTQPTIPPNCFSQAGVTAESAKNHRPLTMSSKFDVEFLPTDVLQAAPVGKPNWLGAQNGTNVWYEVLINEDEYDYVTDSSRQFYNANNQERWINDGNPITLPQGQVSGITGAIELKAAWMEVPTPSDSRWNRYKLASAVILDPATDQCRAATVALVGLHILHLTEKQNTWVWATFEHKDNVPDPSGGGPPPSGGYNFNNPDCQPVKLDVPASCLAEGQTSPVTVTCTPNQPPTYFIGSNCPDPVPIQVTRANGNSNTAVQVNTIAQQAIAKANPESVWQYYDLVNVIWSSSTLENPTSPVKAPESTHGLTSDQINTANTTLETYVQNLTCTDCHKFATTAPTAADPSPPWAADFTFMLGLATFPTSSK